MNGVPATEGTSSRELCWSPEPVCHLGLGVARRSRVREAVRKPEAFGYFRAGTSILINSKCDFS